MKYAVIKTGGKQYKVSEGDTIEVERLPSTPNSEISFSEVLLVAGESTPLVGTPFVAKAYVTGKIVGDVRGEKIRVAKFKAKARYRRVTGHRQALTRVQIVSIAGKSEEKKSESKKAEKTA